MDVVEIACIVTMCIGFGFLLALLMLLVRDKYLQAQDDRLEVMRNIAASECISRMRYHIEHFHEEAEDE